MFNIISLCSLSHRKCLDVCIPTWKNAGADNITIYTDISDCKVDNITFKQIKLSDLWIDNVGLKPKLLLQECDCTSNNLIYIDCDCMIFSDMSNVFNYIYDFAAVTNGYNYLSPFRCQGIVNVSSGVVPFKRNNKTEFFIKQWIKYQKKCIEYNIGLSPKTISYNEISLNMMIADYYSTNSIYVFNSLYNLKITDLLRKQNIDFIINSIKKAKILHFYRKSFQNKEFVSEIMGRKICN